jgi:preprotein translocase subunit YajC
MVPAGVRLSGLLKKTQNKVAVSSSDFIADTPAEPEKRNKIKMETLVTFLPLIMLALVFWLFIYRPQKKQEKEVADMRNSIERGDIIVTAGGIVGMVVKVTEDMLLIESSGNRTKIQLQKWAVHSILEKVNEPEVVEEEKETKKKK